MIAAAMGVLGYVAIFGVAAAIERAASDLRADCGMQFGEWLRYERRAR